MPREIYTLDLEFRGAPHVIASYLIPTSKGAVLIESGPGSTTGKLEAGLKRLGFGLSDITDVFLTHIHLDHAGAAGWLARQGARIHVHPKGAPHLLDPKKLLESATRIYGDAMDALWGEFLPVAESQLVVESDGAKITVGDLELLAIETPGHADHHFAYVVEDLCFAGDVAGVRLPGSDYVSVPTPPPEFHLGKWRDTLTKLRTLEIRRIAPTHFGIFESPAKHLEMLATGLDALAKFIEEVMPGNPLPEEISQRYQEWMNEQYALHHVGGDELNAYEFASPWWMSPGGIQRYWRKYCLNPS
ncbi:MAG TPA: MBL fold metallo-hydrolase [Chthoniobacter sp.]|jgi:glyoxylase-like metal-dependent hydrolase (beta-lactamase superfamily II)